MLLIFLFSRLVLFIMVRFTLRIFIKAIVLLDFSQYCCKSLSSVTNFNRHFISNNFDAWWHGNFTLTFDVAKIWRIRNNKIPDVSHSNKNMQIYCISTVRVLKKNFCLFFFSDLNSKISSLLAFPLFFNYVHIIIATVCLPRLTYSGLLTRNICKNEISVLCVAIPLEDFILRVISIQMESFGPSTKRKGQWKLAQSLKINGTFYALYFLYFFIVNIKINKQILREKKFEIFAKYFIEHEI